MSEQGSGEPPIIVQDNSEVLSGTTPPAPAPTNDAPVSLAAFLFGGIIVIFLTHYNLGSYTIWSSGFTRPFRTFEEYLVVNVTGLMLIPFLLIFGVFRESGDRYGFAPAKPGYGKLTLIFFAAMLPVLLIVSRFPDFRQTYPLQGQAAYSWGYFFYFEIAYGFYLFCWEFFYRGFLTFGLRRRLGDTAAILLQATAFGIMHWGKPIPEFISSFFGGAILGWLAIRARSFFPGFMLHWAIAFTLDCLAIHSKVSGIF